MIRSSAGQVKITRRSALRLAPLMLLPLLLAWPGTVAAQAGQWVVEVTGGVPPHLRGALELSGTGAALGGTLVLETSDSQPLPLVDLHWAGGRISFRVTGSPAALWSGTVDGDHISGSVEGGTDGPRQWSADRLPNGAEYYPALPRFTLREIVLASDPADSVPGAWLAAARAAGLTASVAPAAFRSAVSAAGLSRSVTPDAAGLAALLGGHDRAELLQALERTMAAIGDSIPDPAVRALYRRIFHPRGVWLADLQDVALVAARRRLGGLNWTDAAPALRAMGRLPADAADSAAIPAAVYRLVVDRAADTAQAAAIDRELANAGGNSGAAVKALIAGYDEAAAWYLAAVQFLIREPWIPGPDRGRTLGDLIGDFWGTAAPSSPALVIRYFGYPQGAPRFGVTPGLLARLVRPGNWSARQWLGRRRSAGLLAALQQLAQPLSPLATLEAGDASYRITSIAAQRAASVNGFLGPTDGIALDPGFVPVLALGTLVHEWQHLLFQQLRETNAESGAVCDDGTAVTLVPADPFIAEGIAEWSAEEILRPVVRRWPLVGLSEPAKRAGLALADSTDPHLLGYLLVRTLAGVVPHPAELRNLLVMAASRPGRVFDSPEVRRAWPRDARAATLTPPAGRSALIPETEFTLDTGYPDLVAVRIRTPIFPGCRQYSASGALPPSPAPPSSSPHH